MSIDRKVIDAKGFHSIASSEDLTTVEVYDIYHLCDASEKQYMIMKSQRGFDVARVHSGDSLMGKYALCFAAAIIRYEIMNACHVLGFDTNRMMNQNRSRRKGGGVLQSKRMTLMQ